MGPGSATRAGVTLIELVVTLAVLGGIVAVVGLSWRPGDAWEARRDAAAEAMEAARREALASGLPVEVGVETEDGAFPVRVLPDGRLVGGDAVGWDPLSGRRLRALGEEAP